MVQTAIPIQYTIPDLHANWPFPRQANPHSPVISPISSKWMESFNLWSPARQQKFRLINIGILAEFAYPNHNVEHLRSATDLMNLLFAMDDVSDKLSGEEARRVADASLDALRNPEKERPAGEHPLGETHKCFWSRVLKTASPTAVRRFIPSYEAYVNAMVQEATERETRSIRPSIEEYLELRRSTGAIKPSFDLMLLPLDLPEEVSESAEVRELEIIAIDLIAVANDVVSFNVEQARGDIHNILIVLIEERKLTVQAAMDFVNEWYTARCNQFVKRMDELFASTSPDLPYSEDLRKYVWGLANWVTANYEWSFESQRFFGPLNVDVRKYRVVDLLPSKKTLVAVA